MALFAENDFFIVRSIVSSDINHFCSIVMNKECMKYCPTGKLNHKQAKSLFSVINQQKEGKSRLLAIEDKMTQNMIGFVGLQECCAADEIDLSFVFRLLPHFTYCSHIPSVFKQLIQNMLPLFELATMQAVVAKNNRSTITILESLSFKKIKIIDCRGIESFLYQYQ